MEPIRGSFQSQITFLYYMDLDAAIDFYGKVLGLELVEDQKWAKIYRVQGTAFLGVVSGEKGFHKPQAKNAVTVTLLVDDVPAWYAYLQSSGVKIVRELVTNDDIQVQCFFVEDPGGYAIEFQRFLRPDLVELFHR